MKNWTRAPRRSSGTPDDATFVRAIAQRCAERVKSQLVDQVPRMERAELRGYVRARALASVRQEIAAMAPRDAQHRSALLVLAAVEQTVHCVLHHEWISVRGTQAQRRAA
jgi:hypothetical protein